MTVWATRADQVDLRGPNPPDLARSVKGHENLPAGGHETCPVAATRSAHRQPPDCVSSCVRTSSIVAVVVGCGLRQVGEGNELVTTRAGTADVDAPAEQVAVGTAPVAEVALLAFSDLARAVLAHQGDGLSTATRRRSSVRVDNPVRTAMASVVRPVRSRRVRASSRAARSPTPRSRTVTSAGRYCAVGEPVGAGVRSSAAAAAAARTAATATSNRSPG